jgi:hypothetical protein
MRERAHAIERRMVVFDRIRFRARRATRADGALGEMIGLVARLEAASRMSDRISSWTSPPTRPSGWNQSDANGWHLAPEHALMLGGAFVGIAREERASDVRARCSRRRGPCAIRSASRSNARPRATILLLASRG